MPVECGGAPIETALFFQSSSGRIRVPLLRERTGESQIGEAVDQDGDCLNAESVLLKAFVFKADK